MSVSALQSGYQMLHRSTQMVDESSREFNQAQKQSDAAINNQDQQSTAVNPDSSQDTKNGLKTTTDLTSKSVEKSPDTTDALLKLNQATQYNRVGANVVQRDQDMIGSLLDVHI